MTPERWQRVKDVFQRAAELRPDDRIAFLRRECAGDESLIIEVGELLACHEVAEEGIEKVAAGVVARLQREISPPSGHPSTTPEGKKGAAPTEWPRGSLAEGSAGSPVEGWGRYEHIQFIAEGGMGRVYKALDPVLNRPVALKFLRRDDPRQIARFMPEARAQAQVQHEHIGEVYEVGEGDGRHYIAMQFIDGETLATAAYYEGRYDDAVRAAGNARASSGECQLSQPAVLPESRSYY